MALALTHRLVQNIGDRTVRFAVYLSGLATLIGYGVWRLTLGIGKVSRVRRDVLLRQILFTGVEALRFTSLIAVLVGLIVVVQTRWLGSARHGNGIPCSSTKARAFSTLSGAMAMTSTPASTNR